MVFGEAMKEIFGVVFSATGAALLYFLAGYVLTRSHRDISHYIFALLTISTGTSELLSVFEFTGTKELAFILVHYDLSFLAFGPYFYLMFIDYFREGFNKKFAIATVVPTISMVIMVWTVMITGVEMGPYGWTGTYVDICNIIYGGYAILYLVLGVYMAYAIYRTVEEKHLKTRLKLILSGGAVGAIGTIINVPTIIMYGRVFPIAETSVMILGILIALSFSDRLKSE